MNMNDNAQRLTVTITTGTIVRTALVFLLLGILYYLRDIVLIVLTAVVIATVIEPVALSLEKKKVPRLAAVISVYVAFLMVITSAVYFLVPPVVTEVTRLVSETAGHAGDLILWQPLTDVSLPVDADRVGLAEGFTLQDLLVELSTQLNVLTGGAISIITSVFGGIITFLLIFILSFYLAIRKDGVSHFLELVTPVKHFDYVNDIWRRSQKKIGLWIQGQFMSAVIVTTLIYTGLTILGVPYAILLAALAFFLEFIPFGSGLSAVPGVAVAFLVGGLPFAIVVTVFYVIIQQFDANVIYPLVVKKVVGISPLMVIVAVIAGAKLAGLLGALLAVPFSAVLNEFALDLRKAHKQSLKDAEASKA
jgi:predicted PurR-regulated permease PerM